MIEKLLKKIMTRFYIVICTMIIFSFLLMGKLIYIQVFEGERYKVIASNQTVKNVVLQPSRGNIYSEDGSLMATSVAQYEVRWDSKVPSNSLYNNGKENSKIKLIDWLIKVQKFGCGEILLTSMDRDGTKSGYDVELLKVITDSTNIPVIASGGVGTLDHLYDGIVKGGASAVLAASIFHYGEYKIKEAKEYLNSKNVSVRL